MRELIIGIVLIVEGLVGRRNVPPNHVDAKNVRLDYGKSLMDGGKLIFKKIHKMSSFKSYFFPEN